MCACCCMLGQCLEATYGSRCQVLLHSSSRILPNIMKRCVAAAQLLAHVHTSQHRTWRFCQEGPWPPQATAQHQHRLQQLWPWDGQYDETKHNEQMCIFIGPQLLCVNIYGCNCRQGPPHQFVFDWGFVMGCMVICNLQHCIMSQPLVRVAYLRMASSC